MKLKFKTQQFQTDAVNAVCDLFAGQEKSRATFSIVEDAQISMMQNELGVGNALLIDDAALLENMNTIQRRNKLQLTSNADSRQFCVEMETGERVIIVTGCNNALEVRVSETFIEKNSCIA